MKVKYECTQTSQGANLRAEERRGKYLKEKLHTKWNLNCKLHI